MKFLVFKFLSALFYLIITSASHSIEPPDINNIIIYKDNKSYENVIFKDVNNQDVNLDDFKNKLVIINFWATWCAPCKEEMPHLDKLNSKSTFQHLEIIPINIADEELVKSKEFFEEINIKNLEIFYGPSVELAKAFKLRGVPTTILINKEGYEFARIIGYIDFENKSLLEWLSKQL